MLADESNFGLTNYDSSVLLVRKDYLPLLVYYGKKEHSYWVTMPPTANDELHSKFYDWFHRDFVEIVSHIVKKRNIRLEPGQSKPSEAGNQFGWYLPLGVVLELQKMWTEEKVPMIQELLRPADLIYGKGWTKSDIINVIEDYLYNNPNQEVTPEQISARGQK